MTPDPTLIAALRGVLATDQSTRQAAETYLNTSLANTSAGTQVAQALLAVICAPPASLGLSSTDAEGVASVAAVMLRKTLPVKAADPAAVRAALLATCEAAAGGAFAAAVPAAARPPSHSAPPSPPAHTGGRSALSRKLCHAVAVEASGAHVGQAPWPELLPRVTQWAVAGNGSGAALSAWLVQALADEPLFSLETDAQKTALGYDAAALVAALGAGLAPAAGPVAREACAGAAASLAATLACDHQADAAPYGPLLPAVLASIGDSLNAGREDGASSVLERLIELAAACPLLYVTTALLLLPLLVLQRPAFCSCCSRCS